LITTSEELGGAGGGVDLPVVEVSALAWFICTQIKAKAKSDED
jgi:hypothetical protein